MKDNISPQSVYPTTKGWNHSIRDGQVFSFVDLILTVEAIKHKRWDCLKYVGFRENFENFIYSKPEILEAYDQAVLDTELSMLAKKQKFMKLLPMK